LHIPALGERRSGLAPLLRERSRWVAMPASAPGPRQAEAGRQRAPYGGLKRP